MRTVILDSNHLTGIFLTDLPTQVLVQDEQSIPPLMLARLFFPYADNPLVEISVTFLAKGDPLVDPALETDWQSPGIKVTAASAEETALQPAFTFSICFTSTSADHIIAFLGEGEQTWSAFESQVIGDQVCATSARPGIFVLVKILP